MSDSHMDKDRAARLQHPMSEFGALKMACLAVVMISYGLMGRRLFNYIGNSAWANTISRVLGGGIILAAGAVAQG